MTPKYLIIGATGAIGFSVAKSLEEAGEFATLLVRDRQKAVEKFGNTHGFNIVEGDVTDLEFLKSIAEGTKFIFHGANTSYEHWAKVMPAMTRNIIAAAEHAGATVIFPGNNYNHGPTDQAVSEITPFNPTTQLGKVRVALETMLQRATDQGRIRTLVVRMAEIWGPNVTNKTFAPVFENALKGRAMPWLISADVPQQLLYAPDAGRAIVALTKRADLNPYEVYNIGGTMVPTIRSWLQDIAAVADVPLRISVTPKAIVKLLGLVVPVMREIASLSYKYETSVVLNDHRFRAAEPNFAYSPMRYAIAETLSWFETNGNGSAAKRKARRKGRIDGFVRFAVDNFAIGAFPVALATIALQLPAIESFLPYLMVAAGIYWTPGLHSLSNKIRSRFSSRFAQREKHSELGRSIS